MDTNQFKEKISKRLKVLNEKKESLTEKYFFEIDEIIENCTSYGYTEFLINALSLKSSLFSKLNNFSKAEDTIIEAIEISEKYSNKRLMAISYNFYGLILFNYSFYDKAIDQFKFALNLFKDLDLFSDECKCFRNIGVSFYKKYDINNAYKFLFDGLQISITYQLTDIKADILSWLGRIERDLCNFDKSIEYLLEANKIFLDCNNYQDYAITLNSIGFFYINQMDLEKAFSYLNMAEKIAEDKHFHMLLADVAHNMGLAYSKTDEKEKALNYYYKSVELRKKSMSIEKLAKTYHNIGSVYYSIGNIEDALSYHNKSLKIRKKANLKKAMAESYLSIASVLLKAKRFRSASLSGKKALDIAIDYNDSRLLSEVYLFNSDFYNSQENFKKSYEFFSLYIDENERIFNEEAQRTISNLEKKYELDLLQKSIKEQTEDEQINGAIAMAVTANHQINQPLMILQGNIDLLKLFMEQKYNEDSLKIYFDSIEKSIEDIQSILKFFREHSEVTLQNLADFIQYINVE